MKFNLRNPVIFSVLLAIFFAGSLLRAKEHQPATRASAIQVMTIRADGTRLPAEFQVSLYENLIDQLGKKSVFQHVYRDGDRNAAAEPDLIELQCTVKNSKRVVKRCARLRQSRERLP